MGHKTVIGRIGKKARKGKKARERTTERQTQKDERLGFIGLVKVQSTLQSQVWDPGQSVGPGKTGFVD